VVDLFESFVFYYNFCSNWIFPVKSHCFGFIY
jgi:hypothetical protein